MRESRDFSTNNFYTVHVYVIYPMETLLFINEKCVSGNTDYSNVIPTLHFHFFNISTYVGYFKIFQNIFHQFYTYLRIRYWFKFILCKSLYHENAILYYVLFSLSPDITRYFQIQIFVYKLRFLKNLQQILNEFKFRESEIWLFIQRETWKNFTGKSLFLIKQIISVRCRQFSLNFRFYKMFNIAMSHWFLFISVQQYIFTIKSVKNNSKLFCSSSERWFTFSIDFIHWNRSLENFLVCFFN